MSLELAERQLCGLTTQQFVTVCADGNGESLSVVSFQSLFLVCFARSCSLRAV